MTWVTHVSAALHMTHAGTMPHTTHTGGAPHTTHEGCVPHMTHAGTVTGIQGRKPRLSGLAMDWSKFWEPAH